MPTYLGEPFSPLYRGKYPHMLPEDVPVWNDFLDGNAHLFERVYYDVCVGGVWPDDPNINEALRFSYFKSTAKRIDALAELSNEVWIVEVANAPGLRAVGQLATYGALWLADPKINKPAFMTLVARSVDEDLKRALWVYGVRLRLGNAG